MEAVAAVVCRGGGLRALARPRGGTNRSTRAGRHGVGVAGSPAPTAPRRRPLLVASLGEPITAQSLPSLGEGAAVHETPACSDSVIPSLKPTESIDHSVQVDDEEATSTDTLSPPDDVPTKTVHVKFVLQKQCAFGQRLLVVGEHPALGLWSPAKATALDWSEDHVWTVKKELPAERSIKFKFLLQDPTGHINWQHGPNRILHVTDTSNTLVVCEDWDEAKDQQVSEEIGDAERIFSGSDGVFQEDDLQLGEEQEINKGVTTLGVDGAKSAVVADSYREMVESNDAIQPQLALDKQKKIPDELSGKANMEAQNGNHCDTATAAAGYAGSNGEDAILHKEGEPIENKLGVASIFVNDMAWATKPCISCSGALVSKSARQKHEQSIRERYIRDADLQFSRIARCRGEPANLQGTSVFRTAIENPLRLQRSATTAVHFVSSAKRPEKLLAVHVCLEPVMNELPSTQSVKCIFWLNLLLVVKCILSVG